MSGLELGRPMIHVQDLVKRYRKAERNAVDGISFEVGAGEFFALLGPNGAGKTTTISILTTTLLPTGGRATIAGLDLVTEASAVRRLVGIIFQRPSLDQNLTGEENVRLHAILYGIHPYAPTFRLMEAGYRQRVGELAELLGIGREVFDPVRTYSGGMRRKLEIVRSLMHRPKVLFLDEPTAGLDPPSRRALWAYLDTVRREHATTIFLTTHYIEEAEQADKVCSSTGAWSPPAHGELKAASWTSTSSSTPRTGPRWRPSSPGAASSTRAAARSRCRSTPGGRTRSCARSRRRSA
jgi:ABC-2 type transport system ATP-binding protein